GGEIRQTFWSGCGARWFLGRRFRRPGRPQDASAKCFNVGTLGWIITSKVIEHLPGFVGAASASEDCCEATDRFRVAGRQLGGKAIGLFGFGSVVVRGKEICRGGGVVRIRFERGR